MRQKAWVSSNCTGCRKKYLNKSSRLNLFIHRHNKSVTRMHVYSAYHPPFILLVRISFATRQNILENNRPGMVISCYIGKAHSDNIYSTLNRLKVKLLQLHKWADERVSQHVAALRALDANSGKTGTTVHLTRWSQCCWKQTVAGRKSEVVMTFSGQSPGNSKSFTSFIIRMSSAGEEINMCVPQVFCPKKLTLNNEKALDVVSKRI